MNHLNEESIFDYLHGLAGRSVMEASAAHLRECESCRAILNQEESLEKRLVGLPVVRSSERLTASIMEQIETAPLAQPMKPDRTQYYYWLCVAIVIAFTGLLAPSEPTVSRFGRMLHDFNSAVTSINLGFVYTVLIASCILWGFDRILRRVFYGERQVNYE